MHQSLPVTTTSGTVAYINGQVVFPVQTVGGPYNNRQHQVVMGFSNTSVGPNQPQIVYYPTNQQPTPQARFVDAPPAYDAHQFNDSSRH